MEATQDLVNEHKAVLVALKLLEKIEGSLTAGDEQAPEHLNQLLDFFRGFVDRCHHAKEEDVLFPEMERHGIERGAGPIGVMLDEHEAGRRCVREMAEGLTRLQQGDRGALVGIRQSANAYASLLRGHIEKEEQVLFPMAEQMVSGKQAADLVSRFDAIEREHVGVGKHEEYHAMLDRLRATYGV
jgi:hemerythrin-like domain-containing protein